MDQPNIILIVLDTLRKDVLSMYGGNANVPNLNEFARDGVVFPNPVAPSPWTLPSHMSFFTGKYAIEHGVHEVPEVGIEKNFKLQFEYKDKTIAHILKRKGYTNIGFSANPLISEKSVFAYNFDYFLYNDYSLLSKEQLNLILKHMPIRLANLILNPGFIIQLYKLYRENKLRGWPFKKGGDYIIKNIINSSFPIPFFLFINFMEVHDPYTFFEIIRSHSLRYYYDMLEIKPFPKRVIKKMRNNYLKEVEIVDSYIGKLINYLKNINQYDNSLIIITSDHGQALKEKNFIWHSLFLYNELIEVPLIIKYPKNIKINVSQGYQSLVDLSYLIENAIDNNFVDITKEKAFSESWGYTSVDNLIKEKDKGRYGIPRKAIYKKGYKLVVNKYGDIEEFLYKGKQINSEDKKDVLEDLLDELEIFKSTEKFVVRK